MFDIGQNDLAGSFYSKTLDQILASIPTILLEFETGIKVSVKLYAFTEININEFSFCYLFARNSMTKGLGTFGYTTQALLDACLRMLRNLELIHQSLMN